MKPFRLYFIMLLVLAAIFVAEATDLRSAWAEDDKKTEEKTPKTSEAETKPKQEDKSTKSSEAKPKEQTNGEETMTLPGGEEGTIFKSLRIEGEDRVRIEFQRPTLRVDLDMRNAPGLEWEGIHSVVNRSELDIESPYLDRTASERPPHFARPWLDQFSSGAVARFRPALEGVASWRLVVVNSQGQTVKSFEGKGKPPKEIAWDGTANDGKPSPPGLTYSYGLEAYDRAGNKRNFVGDGFELPAYRVMTREGFAMLFSGQELSSSPQSQPESDATTPAILLEAASWINQSIANPVRVEITARSYDQAKRLATEISRALEPLLLGDPLRVQSLTNAVRDAPEAGTISIIVLSKP